MASLPNNRAHVPNQIANSALLDSGSVETAGILWNMVTMQLQMKLLKRTNISNL